MNNIKTIYNDNGKIIGKINMSNGKYIPVDKNINPIYHVFSIISILFLLSNYQTVLDLVYLFLPIFPLLFVCFVIISMIFLGVNTS